MWCLSSIPRFTFAGVGRGPTSGVGGLAGLFYGTLKWISTYFFGSRGLSFLTCDVLLVTGSPQCVTLVWP